MAEKFYSISINGLETQSGPVALTVAFSLMFHIFVIAAFCFLPQHLLQKPFLTIAPSVISVNMISLAPDEIHSGNDEPLKSAPPLAENTEDVIVEPPEIFNNDDVETPETAEFVPTEQDLIDQAEPVIETSSETSVIAPEKQISKEQVAIENAPPIVKAKEVKEKIQAAAPLKPVKIKKRDPKFVKPKIKTKAVKPETLDVRQRIAQIRRKLDRKEKASKGGLGVTRSGWGTGPNIAGAAGGVYGMQVRSLVEQNWAVSQELVGIRADLQSQVTVTITPDGIIKDMWLKKSSDNRYLDNSALQAVRKVKRFPPLPRGYSKNYTFTLRFTPKGLN